MDLVQVISQVGFPIAVATFCLLKLDKTIIENTTVMKEMMTLIKGVKEID